MQQFGGNWTEEKLGRVKKYLSAYTTIMAKQPFRYAYIDAFAGTGYREAKDVQELDGFLFDEESQGFLDGSVRIALKIQPAFHKYIFIEKDPAKVSELGKITGDYPEKSIDIKIGDANEQIQELCNKDWKKHRAVMFLDPFGMQVTWNTIKLIAETEAIDLWLLFPLGIGVSRLLKRDGNIHSGISKRLDLVFGTHDWYDEFYKQEKEKTLFGDEEKTIKVADFTAISNYFVTRLKTIFSGVADNPLQLMNSCNNPLFLLCFAAGNKKGAKTAIKIAQDILSKE